MEDDQYFDYILALAAQCQASLTQDDLEPSSYDETYQYLCLQDATH